MAATSEQRRAAVVRRLKAMGPQPRPVFRGGVDIDACHYRPGRIKTHGMKSHPLFSRWWGMHSRCRRMEGYADRGITVCERWHDFALFLEDMGKPPTAAHQIDRIDFNGNYEPTNCRWVTPSEQQRNTSKNRLLSFDGRTQCLSAWAEEIGMSPVTLSHRINKLGWPVDRALTTPLSLSHKRYGMHPPKVAAPDDRPLGQPAGADPEKSKGSTS